MMELMLNTITAEDSVSIDFHKFTDPFDALWKSCNL